MRFNGLLADTAIGRWWNRRSPVVQFIILISIVGGGSLIMLMWYGAI